MNKIFSGPLHTPVHVMKGDRVIAQFINKDGTTTEKIFKAREATYLNHMNVYEEDEFDDLTGAFVLAVGKRKE